MEKYKNIIKDWEKFKESCNKPPITSIRKNSLKANGGFKERLCEKFGEVEKSSWNPEVYRLLQQDSPGRSLMHWMGEYYVQEESASIPVEVLNPQEGERILDMCSAPGGKTTQIASKINNKGTVIANDKSSRRMQSLHANIYRTGSACVAATNYDARQIPENQKYDKILVDAPCSGEGDKARRNFRPASQEETRSLSKLQKQIMEKADKLLKPKGTIVYSTCTISPTENEKVVKNILESTELRLEEIKIGAEHSKGLKSFQSQEFTKEARKTIRVYPHHLNSGVIYVAKFKK